MAHCLTTAPWKKSACILCIFCIHWCSNRTVPALPPPTLYSCKSNRKLLLGGLSVLSVRPSWSLSSEMFEPNSAALHPSISTYHCLCFYFPSPVILNAEVFWQVGWIPISCDYQEVDKKSWGQWMTLYFTFSSHLIHNYQADLRVLSTQHFPNWVIFLNSISSADVSLSPDDYWRTRLQLLMNKELLVLRLVEKILCIFQIRWQTFLIILHICQAQLCFLSKC